MIVTDYTPDMRLRPFIKSYKIIESTDTSINRLLPGTSLTMAFRIKGQTALVTGSVKEVLPQALISGIRKTPKFVQYEPWSATIVVLFEENGVAAFIKSPLHELFESNAALDNFFTASELLQLEDQVAPASTHAHRIHLLNDFFISQLQPTKPDLLISDAIQNIKNSNGNLKIRDLSASMSISTDALEKRFRRSVGSSPKQFASIVQMTAVIKELKNSPDRKPAYDSGHFDQAHFIKAFKTFTGLTPGDFLKLTHRW